MGEKEFLELLAKVIRLKDEIKIYNTNFMRFDYELTENKGKLTLKISFPNSLNAVSVEYDTRVGPDFHEKLDEARAYLREKQSIAFKSLS